MNLWAGGWWREGRGSGCDLGSFSSPLGLEDAVEAEGTTGMSEQAGVDFGQRHPQCVSSWNLLAKKKREKLKNIYIIAGKKKKKKKARCPCQNVSPCKTAHRPACLPPALVDGRRSLRLEVLSGIGNASLCRWGRGRGSRVGGLAVSKHGMWRGVSPLEHRAVPLCPPGARD